MEGQKLQGLETRELGRCFLWFDEVDSTNNYCKGNAGTLPHGAVVAAGFQSAGKGTRSRSWESGAGKGLYHSFLLKGIGSDDMPVLPLLAGLAVAEALRGLGAGAGIKWSNDIVVDGKKLCGILCESRIGAGESAAIVGIGVNLTQTAADFERIGLVYATSLQEVTGSALDPLEVAPLILNRFEPILDRYLAEGFDRGLREEYKALCVTIEKEVRILSGNGEETVARAVDINHDGALVVEVDGVRELVRAGDVSVRGIYGYV